jgi:hypothetical protein
MNKTRRRFVSVFATAAVVIPLSGLLALRQAQATDIPQLSPDDPAAKSLMYTHQSADAGWGACVIFPEKLVNAGGVCNSWFMRAS